MSAPHFLFLALALAFAEPITAQILRGSLKADCVVQLKGADKGLTKVTVMPGTAPAYVVIPSNPRFVLDLPLEETYLITFEHAGTTTKQLYVDATVPVEQRTLPFDFPLKVSLEHHDEPFEYAGPVGFIHYQHPITDFGYTTDLTVKVNAHFAERMAALQSTGTDPRSAIVGYSASTSPVAPRNAGLPAGADANSAWSSTAPTVARVAPMVHRLSIVPKVLQESAELPLPTVVLITVVPVLPHVLPLMTLAAKLVPGETLPTVLTVLPAIALQLAIAAKLVPAEVLSAAALPVRPAPPQPRPLAAQLVPVDMLPVALVLLPVISVVRESQLIVESNRVTTIVRYSGQVGPNTEYRRVAHRTGAVYFFLDGRSITERNYITGIATEGSPLPAPVEGGGTVVPL